MKPSLAFGSGAHVCLGMHVARAEMTVGIGALLDRLPNLRLDPDASHRRLVGFYERGAYRHPRRSSGEELRERHATTSSPTSPSSVRSTSGGTRRPTVKSATSGTVRPPSLLTTTGRTTGQARTAALIFGRDGDDYLVVASMGGAPQHPNWYLNLTRTPTPISQVRGEHPDVHARTASQDEKPRLWGIMTEHGPTTTCTRPGPSEIPVVVLTSR